MRLETGPARTGVDSLVRDDGQTLDARGRIPGLDTLRALAVTVVVAYHLAVPHATGGFLGVTLFFVISGYLITRLLLAEAQRRSRLDLPGFWLRRARRLLPAAYTLILASLVLVMVLQPAALTRTREDALAGLSYVSNWWMVVHQIPYFESFDLPSPLNHLWSLAVEEQFYLVWPILLALLLVLVRRRGPILALVGAAIVGSFALMALTFDAVDPNRSYVGTDTRMGELLIGAALAIALHLHTQGDAARAAGWVRGLLERRWASWLLLTSSAALWLALASTLPEQGAFAYRGGILLAAVASAGLVLAVQAPSLAGGASRLDRGPVGAIGRRSYSIYLWHFPILVLASTAATFGDFSWTRSAVVVPATLVCAEVSYRFVEQPIRRTGFRALGAQAFGAVRLLPIAQRSVVAGSAFAVATLPALAMAGLNAAPPPDHGPSVITTGATPLDVQTDEPQTARPQTPQPQNGQADGQSNERGDGEPPGHEVDVRSMGRDLMAVGDSLMIDIADALTGRLPGISINAEVGRQPWTGLDVARSYSQFNRPDGIYLLGIGTNGAIDAADLEQFCRSHRAARILLITPSVDRPWEGASVAAIQAAADQCPNVRVVDFHAAAQGQPGWFGSDGVHLTTAGVRAMVTLIVTELR